MKASEIVRIFRREADDVAQPYLWDDEDATEFLNDAENEACRRARLLVDSTDPECCVYAIVPGDLVIELDPRVLFIRRAKADGRAQPWGRMQLADMDKQRPGWDADTGEPRLYIPDFQTDTIRPYPIPEADDVLRVTVSRLPLNPITVNTLDSKAPEINPRHHRSLVFWMLYRAFSKQDADTYDPKRAQLNLDLFEAEFGKKSTAIDEQWTQMQEGMDDFDGARL